MGAISLAGDFISQRLRACEVQGVKVNSVPVVPVRAVAAAPHSVTLASKDMAPRITRLLSDECVAVVTVLRAATASTPGHLGWVDCVRENDASSSRSLARLVLVLVEHLVKLAERGNKDDRVDVVEAVDPLAALVALAADVEHAEVGCLDLEVGLDYARRPHARAQHVVRRGQVVWVGDPVNRVEVIIGRIVELELAPPAEDLRARERLGK
eukprot:2630044-Pleurochrysis_carterae.AAC.6